MADEFHEASGGDAREPSPAGGFLSKKVGPLPVFGWVLVGGGVAMVLWLLHKRATGSTAGGGAAATVNPGDLSGGIPSNADQLNQQLGTLNSLLQGVVAKPGGLNSPASGGPGTGGYVQNQSWADVFRELASGQKIYYQAAPGDFIEIPQSALSGGSPEQGPFGNVPTYIFSPTASASAPAGSLSGGSGVATQSTTYPSWGPQPNPQDAAYGPALSTR